MSETLKNAIRNVAGRVEHRRVMGILKKSPGALGEPPALLDAIEANTVYVRQREIDEIAEREVYRHGKNLPKKDLQDLSHRVLKIAESLSDLRKAQEHET